MATVKASGSQLTVISTEHTLYTETTAGTYVLSLDLSELVNGDVLDVSINTKVGAGGTVRTLLRNTFSFKQADPIVQTIPVVSPHSVSFVINQSAGVARNIAWEVTSL